MTSCQHVQLLRNVLSKTITLTAALSDITDVYYVTRSTITKKLMQKQQLTGESVSMNIISSMSVHNTHDTKKLCFLIISDQTKFLDFVSANNTINITIL